MLPGLNITAPPLLARIQICDARTHGSTQLPTTIQPNYNSTQGYLNTRLADNRTTRTDTGTTRSILPQPQTTIFQDKLVFWNQHNTYELICVTGPHTPAQPPTTIQPNSNLPRAYVNTRLTGNGTLNIGTSIDRSGGKRTTNLQPPTTIHPDKRVAHTCGKGFIPPQQQTITFHDKLVFWNQHIIHGLICVTGPHTPTQPPTTIQPYSHLPRAYVEARLAGYGTFDIGISIDRSCSKETTNLISPTTIHQDERVVCTQRTISWLICTTGTHTPTQPQPNIQPNSNASYDYDNTRIAGNRTTETSISNDHICGTRTTLPQQPTTIHQDRPIFRNRHIICRLNCVTGTHAPTQPPTTIQPNRNLIREYEHTRLDSIEIPETRTSTDKHCAPRPTEDLCNTRSDYNRATGRTNAAAEDPTITAPSYPTTTAPPGPTTTAPPGRAKIAPPRLTIAPPVPTTTTHQVRQPLRYRFDDTLFAPL